MMMSLVAGLVLGAVLSLRFNVFILIPAICLGLVVVAISGLTRGHTIWSVMEMIAVGVGALQLGYFVGSATHLVAGAKRKSNRRGQSMPTGISRPI
jgi:uncharacterized membrane protein YedE/YeeE